MQPTTQAAYVICAARDWAMGALTQRHPMLRNPSDVVVRVAADGLGSAVVDALHALPAAEDEPAAAGWRARTDGAGVLLERGVGAAAPLRLELHVFDKDPERPRNAYAALYRADTGERWGDACLVFWNRLSAEPSHNVGYAPGRCPDRLG